jgi:hypothetical protein
VDQLDAVGVDGGEEGRIGQEALGVRLLDAEGAE